MSRNDTSPLGDSENSANVEALARESGLAFVTDVTDEMLDPVLVEEIPVEWARSNCVLPVAWRGEICMLTADPRQVNRQEYLTLLTGRDMRPVVASKETILRAIERCYFRRDDSPGEFLRDIGTAADGTTPVRQARSSDLLQTAEKTPVTQLINLILLEAVKRRASDVHFEPFESRLRVRYRIDGILYEHAAPPKHMEEAVVSRLKVMGRMDIAERRLPQDGMAKVRVGEREIDIRVSTVPVAEGERVVLRLLDQSSALLPLSSLGMEAGTLGKFNGLLELPHGMIVVCGPTGSGKTTTLYAALGCLDAARKNIITIEDPIEYQLPDIGQIQVKPKIGLTFATGLRHVLRQDPDIVLVGETRDLETAEIAVRASLTGHLVFTTLHTNDAVGAVTRLVDMGVEPYLLASCLRAALAQRLVRKLCVKCRKEMVADSGEAARLGAAGQGLAGTRVFVPSACPECLEGYAGRTGLFELMVVDGDIRECVRGGHGAVGRLRDLAGKCATASLMADGAEKVRAGITSVAEVVSVAG